MELTSTRPYLLRAIYDWLLDNQLAPHLLVNASMPGVVVPSHYIKEGKIVLNIAPAAVHAFKMDNSWWSSAPVLVARRLMFMCPCARLRPFIPGKTARG
jgi:stringent starvation protein B